MIDDTLAATVSVLRRSFDQSFAKPAVALSQQRGEGLLKLRAGEARLLTRTVEVAGVLRCPRVTALRASHDALLGLGSVRGRLVALYSVAALLTASSAAVEGGFVLLCGAEREVGLVFDELQGHAEVSPEKLLAADSADAGMAGSLIQVDGEHRTLLRLSAVLTELRATSRPEEIHKE